MQTVTSARTATPAIAFLGTGRMGGPMAANLARAGFVVRAWDRTASRAAALTKDGATVAASPAQAVKGAGILITMLADGPATEQALRGPDGGLDLAPGLIWIQMATVGMEWTERFVNTTTRYQVSFFDAPVSGSQGPAEAGELTILASGPSWMQDVRRPGVRRARPRHRLAGPGRPRHQGQAGAQQLARRPHRSHRGNPRLRPPARP